MTPSFQNVAKKLIIWQKRNFSHRTSKTTSNHLKLHEISAKKMFFFSFETENISSNLIF